MQEMRRNPRLIRGFAAIAVVLAVLGLDQLTKYLVASNLEIGQSIVLIPGVLRLTYITNPAAAMGLFGNARWLFMILSPLVVIVIIAYLFLAKKVSKLEIAALSMIAGGGLGNMIDRTFYGSRIGYGEVVDFVDFIAFPKVWNYIFNVADAFVCVGAGLFVLAMILEWKRESDGKKGKPAGVREESAAQIEPSAEPTGSAPKEESPNTQTEAPAGEPEETKNSPPGDPDGTKAADSGEIPEKSDENGTES